MSRKARHRAERPYLFDYPWQWYLREFQNRKWLRVTDRRVRRIRRAVVWAAARDDFRAWWNNE